MTGMLISIMTVEHYHVESSLTKQEEKVWRQQHNESTATTNYFGLNDTPDVMPNEGMTWLCFYYTIAKSSSDDN